MNLNELYERDFSLLGLLKKNACIFIFDGLQRSVLCSFSFMMFINAFICVYITRFIPIFMNFMNFYEVRVFKRFFLRGVCRGDDFMNLKIGFASFRFIKNGGLSHE